MSLQGKRVVITRAAHQVASMVNLLRDTYNAYPILFPCIDIAPPTDKSELDTALHNISDFTWLMLTSRNTVRILAQRIDDLGLSPDFPKIAVVGSSTAELCHELLGVVPDFVPDDFIGSSIASLMTMRNNDNVLLPQSEKVDETLADSLRERGAQVTVITAYENVIGTGGDDVPAMLRSNEIDALTFTSGSTIEGFIKRTKPLDARHLPAACIGPSTAKVANEHGFQHIIVPNTYTVETMLSELDAYFAEHQLERD